MENKMNFKRTFQCKRCGSCCQLIFGLIEVARKGDLERIYRYVKNHFGGLIWGKIQVKSFSEFLYYMKDFQNAKESLGIESPHCPFLTPQMQCLIHQIRPTGCRIFPETPEQSYKLTLDCKGWD